MQQIMNLQGDRLNKFRPVELDYFSKSSNWSDFVELIRRPVQDWLTISDAALDELFFFSAGNPYFAKLIANQLFDDMVENRFSDASEFDVKNAIDKALTTLIAQNSFTHFWNDGLVEESDNAEKIRIIRRSVLIAAGKAFREHSSADAKAMWAEFRNLAGPSVSEQAFRSILQDFKRRKVLIEDQHGNITPKIPLFQSWLKDKGVGELLATTRELEHVRSRLQHEEEVRVTDAEIMELRERLNQFRFRGQAIESSAIRKWLDQFDSPEDQRLMYRLLSKVKFYDENTVRAKMHEALGIVTRDMLTVIEAGSRVRRDILVSSLDESPAKAGPTYCRLFADENRMAVGSLKYLDTLRQEFSSDSRIQRHSRIQRLVFIDDFSGTGQTLLDGLKRELELLRRVNEKGIRIILITVVGFTQARDRVEQFIEQNGLDAYIHFCDELGPEDQAFSERSAIFSNPAERESARQVAEAKGVVLEKRIPLGYGDTQATVIFYQSCPNNTLPILWSPSKDWSPLFPRFS